MATYEDYEVEMQRIEQEQEREQQAIEKARDLYGGDDPNPLEPSMPNIIAQFGEWAVTPFGVECLVYAYSIQWDSLDDSVIGDEFWLRNLAKKEWVNLRDASDAIRIGRQIHRYLQHQASDN